MKTKPFPGENLHIYLDEQQRGLERQAKQPPATAKAEKPRLLEPYWMRCPKCGQPLATKTCGLVEIDLCPSCQGLWLDANELATIVANARHGRFVRSCLKLLRGG